MKRAVIACLVSVSLSCSDGAGDNADESEVGGSGGDAPSGGASGSSSSGSSNGGSSTSGASGEGGASGESGSDGGGGASGRGGSAGTPVDAVPLPPGSREYDGVVNLISADGAAELDAYLMGGASPVYEGSLTASLNVFLEHYVEEYDFVYLITDHPLDTQIGGRFQLVTQPARPGIGLDYDLQREGYKTTGTVRGAVAIQYRTGTYGPFGHEMMHYWANFLDPSFGFGVGLVDDVGPHWGYVGVNGVLGGFEPATLRCESPMGAVPPVCDPASGGRTRYRVRSFGPNDNGVATPCSPFELYLMGLAPFSEVPAEIPMLTDAEILIDTYDEATDTVVVEATGVNTIRTADLVARHGMARELPMSERAFRAAFAVISAAPVPDDLLAEVALWAKIHGNRVADARILSWEALTGGRSTLDTRLGPRRSTADPEPSVRVPFNCDIFDQDCGDGKACYFTGRSVGGICALTRGGVRDTPCDDLGDCAAGLDCVENEAGTTMACEPFCRHDDLGPNGCSAMCDWFTLVDENDAVVGGICMAPN